MKRLLLTWKLFVKRNKLYHLYSVQMPVSSEEWYGINILQFRVIRFGIFKSLKTITYQTTMFEDLESYKEHWIKLIDDPYSWVPSKEIKDRIVFVSNKIE